MSDKLLPQSQSQLRSSSARVAPGLTDLNATGSSGGGTTAKRQRVGGDAAAGKARGKAVATGSNANSEQKEAEVYVIRLTDREIEELAGCTQGQVREKKLALFKNRARIRWFSLRIKNLEKISKSLSSQLTGLRVDDRLQSKRNTLDTAKEG